MNRLRDLALPSAQEAAVGLIVFLALLLFGLDLRTAGSIGTGILIVGIPFCHYLLSLRTVRRRVAVEGPPTLASYFMGPVNLFLLGTLWLLGVSVLVDALNGLAMGEVEFGAGVRATAPVVMVILAWTAFCVGQWIGRRAKRWAVALASAVVISVELINHVSDYVFIPADTYLSVHGFPRQLTSVLLGASIGTMELLVLSCTDKRYMI